MSQELTMEQHDQIMWLWQKCGALQAECIELRSRLATERAERELVEQERDAALLEIDRIRQ